MCAGLLCAGCARAGVSKLQQPFLIAKFGGMKLRYKKTVRLFAQVKNNH